ncbi:MarR family winged helix-turn-helix transcriptional regulator [Fusibacter sp. 3D3]|uniref:MarR family winged helix-turn-helix transcriptional regulator n=1 Tax=Fusibacter sp. 3D3 TaxID=1048380 RepID=UPI000853BE4E|nr:MarR family transcriptional regulator [Fusibacter sp. 3D3]GAU79944.1 hypothetical protein F3D3_4609 [Fusibacter sp. 3D3]
MSKLHLMSKMGIVYLNWTRKLQKDLVPFKITLKQQFVLRALMKKEYLLPSHIADMLYCDRPTASVIIKNMEKNKWIVKEKDPENGKQYFIKITELGAQKFNDLRGASGPEAMVRHDPLNCLSEKERETLDVLLTKVMRNL